MNAPKHVALYGSVMMIREKIGSQWHIRPIEDGEPIVGLETKRMSGCEQRRRKPSVKQQARLHDLYNHCCVYCDRRFGSKVWIGLEEKRIICHWDHFIPHAYSLDNSDINFLPACQFCNGWKTDRIFNTISEVRSFVDEYWANKLAA